MLLTKTVMVKWNGGTKKHYISKGYTFTKINDSFDVIVEDLTKGSHSLVNAKCDCEDCRTPITKPMDWRTYLSCVREDGKYYCHRCAIKLIIREKIERVKVKKSVNDFEKWCYNNLTKEEATEILSRWNSDLNKCSPNEVGFSSNGANKKGYWFKCLEHPEHGSELKSIADFTHGHKGTMNCNQCNSFAQWGIDNIDSDFLNLYWDYAKNIISPWNISHGNSDKKVWVFCQDDIKKSYHNSYDMLPNSFSNGQRCSYCGNFEVHPLDSLGWLYPQVFKIWSDKNNTSPYEYTPNSHTYVWWKCPNEKHEDFYRSINDSNTLDFRCSYCTKERNESFLQEKVRLYLETLNYNILHEHKCTLVPRNPRTKKGNNTLPFDNEVVELKLIIEVHGSQHYKLSTWHKHKAKHRGTTPEEEFHYQKLKDRYKSYVAYRRGYDFLEIPYWTDDEDMTWKSLIDNKIKEIKNKTI